MQFGGDGLLEGLGRDAPGGAGLCAGGLATLVVWAGHVAFDAQSFTGEQTSAQGAARQTAEQVGGVLAAWVGRVVLVGFSAHSAAGLADGLYGLPGGCIDEGFAVIRDDHIAVAQLAAVQPVGEEGGVAVEAAEEMGGFLNLGVAGTGCAHVKGLLAACPGIRIRHPAAGDVGGSVAAFADGNGFALEAARGRAGDDAVNLGVVAQAAPDVFAEFFEELVGHPIQGGFEEAPVGAVRDGIADRYDLIAPPAQVGFVVGGVVDVAGEAREFPDHYAGDLRRFLGAQGVDHCHELLSADDGGARRGDIPVNGLEDDPAIGAPGADDGFLLVDGDVLVIASGVAQVGDEERAG